MSPGPKCSAGACLAAAAIAALLAACATPARRVDVPLPAKFEWNARDVTPSWPTGEWFKDFGSAELTSLMSEALQQNLDLIASGEHEHTCEGL
jgi:outer membrane protein TolC